MSDGTKEIASVTDDVVPAGTGAEALLDFLNYSDVDYMFINPGSDHVPILEAIWKYRYLGKRAPRTILCLHEHLALSAAHGHFLVSEKPQVVLVHADVGTQQLGGSLHNAQRGMAGVIVCAGCVPWSPEDRNMASMYNQEDLDQAGLVRGSVKWYHELRCSDDIDHVVQRAFQIASSEPHGPVYLILPREPLMERTRKAHALCRTKFGAPVALGVDNSVADQVANLLVHSENPLLTTSYLGRHPQAVAPLVGLAETLGMRVVSQDARMNFPTNHPLWAGIVADQYLKDADVVLIVDHHQPYLPTDVQPAPHAKVIYIDIDPVRSDQPLWEFPADIRIRADSSQAIPALCQAVSKLATPEDRERCRQRFQRLQKEHETTRAGWEASAKARAGQRPISPEWLAYCIGQEVNDDDIVINEAISNWPAVSHHLRRSKPGTIFRAIGTSLGWGLGLALGAKLASPQSTVVCLTTDGAFSFGEPVAALWAANRYNAPFLTIVFNNQSYNTLKKAVTKTYGSKSYSAKLGECEEIEFTPPDYARIAQALDVGGETVQAPESLPQAIRSGLKRVRDGQSVVLDVWLERPQ